jgi:hypothetical protein
MDTDYMCSRRSISRDEFSSTYDAIALKSNQMEAWKPPTYLEASCDLGRSRKTLKSPADEKTLTNGGMIPPLAIRC